MTTWDSIVKEYEHLIGRNFKEKDTGLCFNFFGLVHGDDDYYYGLFRKHDNLLYLISCVGSLDMLFDLVDE
jgi:hypothetical protein